MAKGPRLLTISTGSLPESLCEDAEFSCEDFVTEAAKLGSLFLDLAKESYKLFEAVLAKVSAMK